MGVGVWRYDRGGSNSLDVGGRRRGRLRRGTGDRTGPTGVGKATLLDTLASALDAEPGREIAFDGGDLA